MSRFTSISVFGVNVQKKKKVFLKLAIYYIKLLYAICYINISKYSVDKFTNQNYNYDEAVFTSLRFSTYYCFIDIKLGHHRQIIIKSDIIFEKTKIIMISRTFRESQNMLIQDIITPKDSHKP